MLYRKKTPQVSSLEVTTTMSKQELSYLMPPKTSEQIYRQSCPQNSLYKVYEMNLKGSPLEKQEGAAVIGVVLKQGRKRDLPNLLSLGGGGAQTGQVVSRRAPQRKLLGFNTI